MKESLGYEGKICVVTGAASGMGRATTGLLVKLGARVYALDISPIEVEGVEAGIRVDLGDKDSIDAAFTQIPASVDCFFGVAGVMGAAFPFLKTVKINLLSNKYMAEQLLPQRMGEGGAISFIASAIASGWQKQGNLKYFKDVVDADGWDAALEALQAGGMDQLSPLLAYPYSKMAMCYLISKLQSLYGPKHVRVNGVCPGATRSAFGSESADVYQVNASTDDAEFMAFAGYSGRIAAPEEMAYPLLYLNSKYASYISGAIVFADYGINAEVEAGLRPNYIGGTLEEILRQGNG